MARKKRNGKVKRLIASVLAAMFLMECGISDVSVENVQAKEQKAVTVASDTLSDSTLITSDAECVYGEESTDLTNAKSKKVAVDPTSIAATQIYKDMDYSFLKDFPFGQTHDDLVTATFGNTEELKKSKDVRLVSGKIIKTEGYYESGDGGSAVYEVLSEYDMNKSKRVHGSIGLANGYYACIVPDVYEINGKKWKIVNILQYGAKGDGITESQGAIGSTIASVSKHTAEDIACFRGIAYIPTGEYKCTNELVSDGAENVNIVGEGDSSVLFTDNDYRKDLGYSEFLFTVWNGKNLYFGDFRIEAREVDLYHYMRQFVLVYCDNIYISNVDLIIPQESWSGYYFEDKQYSNFTCFSGNTNVTVDGCTFVLYSGTYRGANVGIMDFWNRKVENITVMNCDLYSNARDEQIGIFNIPKTGSKVNENTSISNIDLINNTIHTAPVKYAEVVGNQNMCFTVAYSDSVRIDDVRIAGNHFICQADSKFMTFGKLTNCVVEDNIIELITTRNNGASVFDSSNSDTANILIRNNEFFLTSENGTCNKASMTQGRMTLEGNRIFSDGGMSFGIVGQVAKNNEIIFLKHVGYAAGGVQLIENNTFRLYGGGGDNNCNGIFDLTAASGVKDAIIKNNTIYDYSYYIGRRNGFQALINVTGYEGKERAEFSGNTYYAPNKKYTSADGYNTEDSERADVDWITDENGKIQVTDYYNRMFYMRVPDDEIPCTLKELVVKDNTLQGVKGYVHWNNKVQTDGNLKVKYTLRNNTTLPNNKNLSEDDLLVSSIDILYNNQKTTEIAVTGDTVKLDKIIRVAARDEEGKILDEKVVTDKEIDWYTSVESIATVGEDGTVTRNLYGDVKVYAVATDGSGIYGECTVHFVNKTATKLSFTKKKVELEPGLKYYVDYAVLPKMEKTQQLKWTSSDENVATVSQTGLITAVSVGKAVIKGTTTDGSNLSASLTVEVKPVTVKRMSMNHPWLRYTQEQIGETKQLRVESYSPDNATNKTVKRWESLDPSVATVDAKGKVTVVGGGRAEIRAYSSDEYCYARCVVFVEPDQVKNFKATSVLQNKVSLSWEPMENCYGYYLYQWDANTKKWTMLNGGKELAKDKTSYTVSDLAANTEYKFCIRSYYINYTDLENSPYESKDSVVTVKTYSYNPVTYIKGATDLFTIVDHSWGNHRGEFAITYNAQANYEKLKFDCEIADEGIVKIVSVEDGSKAGEKKIILEGVKYGVTTLTVTANDAEQVSVQIPVGFITAKQVKNCKAEPTYKQVAISFEGLEDESSIDGYYVCSMVSMYKYNEVAYIPKTGATTYYTVDKNVEVGGGSYKGGYKYVVSPCIKDGTNYHKGYGLYANKESIVQIPEPTRATSLEMGQNQYVVKGGESIEVSAKVGNQDASTNQLYWEVINEAYASVKRIEKEDGNALTDYANITGIDAGVTKIKAITTDGSNIETTAKLIVAPAPVKNLRAEVKKRNISLKWSDVTNADGYLVYKWDEKKKAFKQIADVKEAYFTDTNMEENASCRYQIAAYIEEDGVRYTGDFSTKMGVLVIGHTYTSAGSIYKITGDNTVCITGVRNKKKTSVLVKNKVEIFGKTYKVTAIGENAFKNSKKLKKVTIGENVTIIDKNAFYGCSKLKKVTIPSKVTKIGKQAFYACRNLKNITIQTSKLKSSRIGKNAFAKTPKNVKIIVPKSKVKIYDKMLKKKGIAKTGKVSE